MTDEKIARIEHRLTVDKADGCHLAQTETIDDVLALIARLRAAEAIVAKLPKTADGVRVVPGMRVWCVGGKYIDEREVLGPHGQHSLLTLEFHPHNGGYATTHRLAKDCYSTEAAARAASAPSPGAQGGTEGAGKP